jgi:FkbM family methyltransferase
MPKHRLDASIAGNRISFDMELNSESAADNELLTALRIAGCPEPEVSELFARVLKPGDYVIDGGANIGFFSLLAAHLVGKEGYVLSFEPGVNNLPSLTENIKINKLTNVEIVPQPLWDKHELVQLHLCHDGSKNSLAAHDGTRGASSLETAVLDDFATDEITKHLRLIKLDIEGAELKALQGGTEFLFEPHQCPYIVMELNVEALPKFDASIDKMRGFMSEHGYSMFLLHFDGSLPSYVPRQTKVTPNRLNWNVLFSTFEMVGKAWPEIVA